jgi:subtilisin family serine protease
MKQLFLALLVVFSTTAPTSSASVSLTRWIITFKPSVKHQTRQNRVADLGGTAIAHIASEGSTEDEFSAVVMDLPTGQTPSVGGDIISVEVDRREKWIEDWEVDLRFIRGAVKAYALRPEETWGIVRLHVPAAWEVTQAQGVKVAIVDTGIDGSHDDLTGLVDGGYSALTKSENPESYQDDNGHGTHVAGIVAARRDGRGVVGVAPRARLYAVKVLDSDGTGSVSDIIDGIVWAAKNGIQVMNLSIGSSVDSDALHRAVRYARSKGVVLVAAAGNAGQSVSFPGAYAEAICVTASDPEDRLAVFSNYGPEVDFIAPGVDILSDRLGGGVVSYSGTSMAAPHVTGLVALSISQGWSGLSGPDGVLRQLQKSAKPLTGLSVNEQGHGMVDAGRLVQ